MEERRHPDSIELLIRKTHLHRDRPRQIRNSPLMAGGIGILGLHGQGQSFKRSSHRPPQIDQRPAQILLLLATVRKRPLEVAGPFPDGQFQSRSVTQKEVKQSGQQKEDGERDAAELEERFLNGGVPSAQRHGCQFPGAVGEIDFAEDGISLQDGLFPIEEMIGAVLEVSSIPTGGGSGAASANTGEMSQEIETRPQKVSPL